MTTAQEPTLTVLQDGTPIFTSHGTWLHPLFELEEYLADHACQPAQLLLQDKIIGKAAALLIHRLGFRTVKAGVLSRLGEAVLQRHCIVYTYEQLVEPRFRTTHVSLSNFWVPIQSLCKGGDYATLVPP